MPTSSERETAVSTAAAVDRICASSGFRRSIRLQRFLRFLASTHVSAGCGPKEYEIAREVYDKPEDFNPQVDPIVRVEAGRLRLRLAEYYRESGHGDEFVVELPKGKYTLRYRPRGGGEDAPIDQAVDAHKHYLRGRYLWSRRTAESLEQAIVNFRRAIDEDCLNAAAWSGLADCYLVIASFELMRPDVVLPRAIAAARRALEVDSRSAEAHTSLAAATAFYTCDAETAFIHFEKAIALDQDYASAWHFYGVVLFGRKLYDRALHALQRAQLLDPLSPIFDVQIASLYYLRREFRKAASLCDDLIRLDPEFWPARWFGGMALEQQGRTEEARRYLETAIGKSCGSHWPLAALGHLQASTGSEDQAISIASELERRRDAGHCSASAIALVHVGLRQYETAFHWLDLARQEHSPFFAMFFAGDPRLDCIRSNPRCQSLTELCCGDSRG